MHNLKTNAHLKLNFSLALLGSLLALFVIGLGAYTRLTDAGLGCPDWPGCYGHWIISKSNAIHATIDTTKAWTEMIHRYMAGSLGLLVLLLAIFAIYNRRKPQQPLLLPLTLLTLVLFQALLGMWTVTLKLLPVVVMAHLFGGLITLSLLWWLTLQFMPSFKLIDAPIIQIRSLRVLAIGALLILILQLLLGGWTSANYAALDCLDFPLCRLPKNYKFNLLKAFDFTAGVAGSAGTPLDQNSRITIQILHRIGALCSTIVIGCLFLLTSFREKNSIIRLLSLVLFILLVIQIFLGITNVVALLPLVVAVAHNLEAALLLLNLITFNYYLYHQPKLNKHG